MIVQRPDTLSLSGNLKKFIVSSGSPVSFVLKDGATVLLDATYEPAADGRVSIDVKEIVESRLSFLLSHNNFYEQTALAKTFTAIVDGETVTFKAIRAGVANLADTHTNWLKLNFLTWQPTTKTVTYYSPEWLTYYAVENCTLKLKAYFPDGTDQVADIGNMVAGKAYTANLQYAVVAGLLGQKYPSFYEVRVENASGEQLSYKQRYAYSEPKSELEQWFLFENSLGGIDTIRAYGDTDFEGDHEHKISFIEGVSSEYIIDTKRLYKKNTGYLDEYERRWLLDFFPSRQKFIHFNSAIRSIVVTESDVKYSAADLPSSYTFKYSFSNDSSLLNLVRNEEQIPADIVIPDISSPDFILPPRLSEYPRVTLSEGVILPAFDPHSETPKIMTVGALAGAIMEETLAAIPGADEGGTMVQVLDEDSVVAPSNKNVFSALRVIKEITQRIQNSFSDFFNSIKDKFLRKDVEDTAAEKIKFQKGLDVGEYTHGDLGGGGTFRMRDGSSFMETDFLKVRKKAEFLEVMIRRAEHIGGEFIMSTARMVCSKMEDRTDAYRCYFEKGENNENPNDFKVNDQARCQVFTGSGTKYYWRLVTAVGDNWIDISKTVADTNSDAPAVGDHIFQLGNPNDTERQSAMIFSTIGYDAPSWKQYSGINSFSLEGKQTTVFTSKGNIIDGKTVFIYGQKLEDWILDNMPEIPDFEMPEIGGQNLLRNAGFLGDFASLDLASEKGILESTEFYNRNLAYWESTGDNTVIDVQAAKSKKGVNLNGKISQQVQAIANEKYKFSAVGKGSVTVTFGTAQTIDFGSEYSEKELDFTASASGLIKFSLSGSDAYVYNPQLERGTVKTDFGFNPLDENPAFERLKALDYIFKAISEGNSSMLGGLILASMLQVGNYKDGVLQKATGGISGTWNSDNDVAFWAGGTFEEAIKTVQKLLDNPSADLSESEWAELANFVVTHGGRVIANDAIFRGYIYALGGIFRGDVYAENGIFKGVIQATDGTLNGFVRTPFAELAASATHDSMSIDGDIWSFNTSANAMFSAVINPTVFGYTVNLPANNINGTKLSFYNERDKPESGQDPSLKMFYVKINAGTDFIIDNDKNKVNEISIFAKTYVELTGIPGLGWLVTNYIENVE